MSSSIWRRALAVLLCISSLAFGLAVPASASSAVTLTDDAAARDLRLGKGLYDQRLFERAISPLERVRSGDADAEQRQEALFLLGETYRSLERLDEAEVRFGELIEAAPRSEWADLARLGRGEVLVRLDRAPEALDLLRAAARGPESERPAAQYWLAEALARIGRVDEAIAGWRALAAASPEHELAPFAVYNGALRLRDSQRPKDGLELIDTLDVEGLESSLEDRIHLLAGELALAAEDATRALAEYRAVEGEASLAAALAGIAWAASATGDTAALEIARSRLARKHPGSPERREIDLLFGSARAEAGDIAGTDAALAPHLEGPRGAEARFWSAWARRAAGRSEEAAEAFLTVTGSGPWASRAVLRAEEELRKAGKWSEALAAARRFVESWGDDPRASAVIAGAVESSYRLGEDARVTDLEKRFLERWPDDPLEAAVRHFAAESALRTGDAAGAASRFALLWQEPARRAAIAPRYAWALTQVGGPTAADRIAELTGSLEGTAACEVGILLGRARGEHGDPAGALAAFRAAAAADPTGEAGARARLEEAILLGSGAGADNSGAAEAAYRAVLEGSADEKVRARARIDLATLLAARGADAEAAQEFSGYLDDHPEDTARVDAWIGLAFCRWRLDDLDGAIAAVAGAREDDPDPGRRGEILYVEGRVRQASGDNAAANRALSGYLANHGDGVRAPEVLRELARIHEESGDATAARRHLERRLEAYPDAAGNDEALYRLAWLEGEAGETAAAAVRFRSLLETYPQSTFRGDAHFRLGEIAYAAGDYEVARGAYRAAIGSPDGERLAERARYRIGWSHRRAEEWGPSQKAFEALVAEHPGGDLAGEALYLAADAAGRIEDTAGERALLESFLADHPTHERSAAAKIRCSELLGGEESWGRIRDLCQPLRTVSLDEPWRSRHRIILGRAWTRLGSGRTALPILKDALDEGGARAAEAQFEIGLAHRAEGDRDRAVDAFINGSVLYPFKPWAIRSCVEAGRDLLHSGKRSEAKKMLERAIAEDPSGPFGLEAKKLLGQNPEKEAF